jgi:hypothetical protein
MKKWWSLLVYFPASFAVLGGLLTFVPYWIPTLRSNVILPFLIPVRVIVDFGIRYQKVPIDVALEEARAAAPWNALFYSAVGFVVGFAFTVARSQYSGRKPRPSGA